MQLLLETYIFVIRHWSLLSKESVKAKPDSKETVLWPIFASWYHHRDLRFLPNSTKNCYKCIIANILLQQNKKISTISLPRISLAVLF